MKTLVNVAMCFFLAMGNLISLPSIAQSETQSNPLYIIFDASNSMWGELPDKNRKITVAKDVFNNLGAEFFNNREVALRLYGHRRASDCSDTELAVPFTTSGNVVGKISEIVNGVSPKGKTPISRSLNAALEDFAGRSGDILLISDGIETCDQDPCELVQSWRDNNIDIRVHVVGLGLSDLSRDAMQCIANASGTRYLDANSAGELIDSIEIAVSSVVTGAADPQPQSMGPEFKIVGEDKNGNYLPVAGTIIRQGIPVEKIASNQRYVFEGGLYSITVGVPTVNGTIYKPITRDVEVSPDSTTKVVVQLQRPPAIRTRFLENGKQVGGVNANVFQDGKEVFRLRPGEDYFVMPGDYLFTARLNKDNKLETFDSIVIGDDKDIVFTAVETVHTTFNVFAQGQDKKLRQHQELWQNGELKYKVHVHNGAAIRPGTYTLKSNHALTGYEIKDIEVPAVEQQTLELFIPTGSARINYVFIEQPDRDGRRCWLYSIDSDGKRAKDRSGGLHCDGSEISLVEGRYFVLTWSYLGEFEDTYFDVIAGQTTEVNVQQKAL